MSCGSPAGSTSLPRRLSAFHRSDMAYELQPIGYLRSTLHNTNDAPRQGSEGAPDAWLEIESAFVPALRGVQASDELVLITWLHRANRDVLEVHPRGDPNNPLTGVFATRSQHRPNPLGLHRVTVREITGNRLRVGPIEAVESTPAVDVKIALEGQ